MRGSSALGFGSFGQAKEQEEALLQRTSIAIKSQW
jgi:hypothetical protein